MRRRVQLILALAGVALSAAPAQARKKPPPPAAVVAPVNPAALLAPSGDAGVDAYYYYDRMGAPLWLGSETGRAAAARVAAILRRAPIDGLAEGPALAAVVDAAIARGTPSDDKVISAAWMKYVRALAAPIADVDYGDPALAPKVPLARQALAQAAAAPSLLAFVDKVAGVNTFYSALRDAALTGGQGDDPHVKATLARLRLIPAAGKVIVVDTANARLMMVEDGTVVGSMKTVVGKLISPTPLIAGTVHYVTLNPYWNIPTDVVRRKVAPIVIKRGTSYLTAARYETTDKWGSTAVAVDPKSIDWKAVAAGDAKAYMRQLPGVHNMMGKMKFGFANDFDIFLHDTPHRELFAKDRRNLSMGCVRLEHADVLARWLLGSDPDVTSDTPEQQVALAAGVPVYTVYLTANVDNGHVVFADDVYGFDKPGGTALPAGPVADPGS